MLRGSLLRRLECSCPPAPPRARLRLQLLGGGACASVGAAAAARRAGSGMAVAAAAAAAHPLAPPLARAATAAAASSPPAVSPLTRELPGIPRLIPARNLPTPTVRLTTLPNGLRVTTQETYGQVASIALFVDAGSMYEDGESIGEGGGR